MHETVYRRDAFGTKFIVKVITLADVTEVKVFDGKRDAIWLCVLKPDGTVHVRLNNIQRWQRFHSPYAAIRNIMTVHRDVLRVEALHRGY